jgi:hypothetical protein
MQEILVLPIFWSNWQLKSVRNERQQGEGMEIKWKSIRCTSWTDTLVSSVGALIVYWCRSVWSWRSLKVFSTGWTDGTSVHAYYVATSFCGPFLGLFLMMQYYVAISFQKCCNLQHNFKNVALVPYSCCSRARQSVAIHYIVSMVLGFNSQSHMLSY